MWIGWSFWFCHVTIQWQPMALEEPQLHCHAHSDTRHTNIHGIGKTPFPLPYPVLHYPSTVNCCFALYFHCWQAYTLEYPPVCCHHFSGPSYAGLLFMVPGNLPLFKICRPSVPTYPLCRVMVPTTAFPSTPQGTKVIKVPILTCSSDIHTGLWFYGLGLWPNFSLSSSRPRTYSNRQPPCMFPYAGLWYSLFCMSLYWPIRMSRPMALDTPCALPFVVHDLQQHRLLPGGIAYARVLFLSRPTGGL